MGTIVVTGGTGLVGGALLPALAARGDEVRALVRRAGQPGPLGQPGRLAGVREYTWDGTTPPPEALHGAEAVVHLSGEPVFGGLPTAARRARLFSSRVDSTEAFVAAFAARPASERPRTFLCASAVGYYGDRGDEPLPESAGPGQGLLAELCVAWEGAAAAAGSLGVRVCSLRIGIVLARAGGALPMMARPFRLGVGGRVGSGRQWVPWIHLDDLVALILVALEDPRFEGPVNAVAPAPARNEDLTRAMASILRRPAFVPVPAFAVRAALGPLSAELLGSKRVVPARAEALGFRFRHPDLAEALRTVL